MIRADIIAANASSSPAFWVGGGTNYPIQKNGEPDTFYIVYMDGVSDVVYIKSTDGGKSWSNPIAVFVGTARTVAVWYDRWSGRSSDKVRIAYTEDINSDILYRDLDISTDTLGTETTVFNGASSGGNGALTIVTGRDGRIAVAGSIDAGLEDGAWSSTDDGATWGDTIADPSEGGSTDQYFLLPGWNADQADLMLVFGDASANGLSVKRYDDSANTWTETAIIADGSFIDTTPANTYPHVACVADLANSRNIIAAWTQVDTANADLRCFIIDDTTITETSANVVLNSSDDQGLAAVAIDIDTGAWWVFYAGKSDGSETWFSSVKIYFKISTDDGSNWSAEQALSKQTRGTAWMACTPRFSRKFLVAFHSDLVTDQIVVSADVMQPRARMAIGVS